jgi:phospholipase/carboxylesterase
MKGAGPVHGHATAGIVLLHGRGGSAEDVLGLLSHAALPDIAALAPEAPGNSWWPTSFLAPSALIEPYVVKGVQAVHEAVAVLEAGGLPRGRIWLGGFSQGACLALEAFARVGGGLAGVIALSGGLVGTADASGGREPALYGHVPKAFDYTGSRQGADVWISVHAQDPHIPVKRVEDSASVLSALGARVQTRIYPGAGHGVTRDDLAAIRARLNG